ncbi:hypothetical protein FNV43_RR01045 [Rhamnella rubrinervis]|uniref:RNase H type-1 domain-containing protein n=1 Tax=Rhamnella rubrinervis TaxID=2594499 RepID=A0A8K0MSZ0_9ROSA|nr:hypothetical protein FNV43_RR01045 [Rhamnella rubrinervis]
MKHYGTQTNKKEEDKKEDEEDKKEDEVDKKEEQNKKKKERNKKEEDKKKELVWDVPDENYLKLNLDASFKNNTMTYGGVVRDSSGNGIKGFTKKHRTFLGYVRIGRRIVKAEAHLVESYGLLAGMRFAGEENYRLLIIHLDAKDNVGWLNEPPVKESITSKPIIEKC